MPRLNKELLLKVADEIENNGPSMPKFGMSNFIYVPDSKRNLPVSDLKVCDTACCVAGHVSLLHVKLPKKVKTVLGLIVLSHDERAERALGLTYSQAEALFQPYDFENNRKYPRKRTAAVLRHLAATGQIEWDARKRRKAADAMRDEGETA